MIPKSEMSVVETGPRQLDYTVTVEGSDAVFSYRGVWDYQTRQWDLYGPDGENHGRHHDRTDMAITIAGDVAERTRT